MKRPELVRAVMEWANDPTSMPAWRFVVGGPHERTFETVVLYKDHILQQDTLAQVDDYIDSMVEVQQ